MSTGPSGEAGTSVPVPRPAWHDDPAAVRDAELLAAHAAGDPDAFAELVHRHGERLWAVALRTLGDREEAADALQDALVNAHRAAATYRGDARVTTWLHRVVVNACLDRARRQAVRRTVPLPGADDERGAREPADPRDLFGEADTAREVQAALAALPVEQRAALVLVDVQGYGVEEAARVLGVATGTVKSRCSRGRARMAVLLGHLRDAGNRPAPGGVPPRDGGAAGSGRGGAGGGGTR